MNGRATLLYVPVFEGKALTRVPVSLTFASVQFNSNRQGKEGQSPRKLSLPREGKLVGQDHGEPARRPFSSFLSWNGLGRD